MTPASLASRGFEDGLADDGLRVGRQGGVGADGPPVLRDLAVPLDGALEPRVEVDLGLPAELVKLGRVDVVAHVVERAVDDNVERSSDVLNEDVVALVRAPM